MLKSIPECLKASATPQQPLQALILQKCRSSILGSWKKASICGEFLKYFGFLRTEMCGLKEKKKKKKNFTCFYPISKNT